MVHLSTDKDQDLQVLCVSYILLFAIETGKEYKYCADICCPSISNQPLLPDIRSPNDTYMFDSVFLICFTDKPIASADQDGVSNASPSSFVLLSSTWSSFCLPFGEFTY